MSICQKDQSTDRVTSRLITTTHRAYLDIYVTPGTAVIKCDQKMSIEKCASHFTV